MSTINIQDIINQVQQAQTKANAENEARYAQLIQSIQGLSGNNQQLYSGILGNIGQMGQTAMTRIAQNEAKQKGAAQQDLISRGLGNTTIRNSVLSGVGKAAEQARQSEQEKMANLKSSALESQAGNNLSVENMLANAIQNRNDIGPNLSMYANLIQQAAAANLQNKKLQASIPASNQQINGPGFGGVSPVGSGFGGGSSPGTSSFGQSGGTGGGNGGTGGGNGGGGSGAYVVNRNGMGLPAPTSGPSSYIQGLAGQLGDTAQTASTPAPAPKPAPKKFLPWYLSWGLS